MVKIIFKTLFVIVFLAPNPLLSQEINFSSTSISEERFPRVLGFRNTELALLRSSIFAEDENGNLIPDTIGNGASIRIPRTEDEMVNDFRRYSVIGGKSLFEEKRGNMDRVRSAYNRVKIEQPGTTVLLHFNGRNRDPLYRINQEMFGDDASQFFPGHYILNTPIKQIEVSSAEEALTIQLEPTDLETFVTNGEVNDDLYFLIYKLDSNGNPDYYTSEYLLAIDLDSLDRLVFERDIYDFGSAEFSDQDVLEISQIGNFNDKRLIYNFSDNAPLDSLGRTCTDVLVDEIHTNFSSGGILQMYDGIILDAATVQDQYNQFGIGFENGVYLPISGYIEFCRKIRDRMGNDFIISADNRFARHQRAFQYLNGCESENWPQGQDAEFMEEWSTGLERHKFIASKVMEPRFDHFNTHSNNFNENRITEAVASILGAAHSCQYRMRLSDSLIVGYSDEMCRGTKFDFSGWLGKPISDILNWVKMDQDNFIDLSNIGSDLMLAPSSTIAETGLPTSELNVEGIEVTDGEIYLEFDFEAQSMEGYPENMPRILWVTAENVGEDISTTFNNCKSPNFSSNTISAQKYYIDEDGETVGMYLRWLNKDLLNLNFLIEGTEAATLKSMRAYSGPNVLMREFEHGLVIANPAAHEVTLDLTELFPGDTISRLEGFFDVEVNNGESIKGPITIPCLDGLFLEKSSLISNIDEFERTEIAVNIFPNPSNDEINVLFENDNTPCTIEIISLSGQKILRTSTESNFKKIDISTLESGIYFLKISNFNEQKFTCKKILKL